MRIFSFTKHCIREQLQMPFFGFLDGFIRESNSDWSRCVGISIDRVRAMTGICSEVDACVKTVTRSKIYSLLHPQGIITSSGENTR
jgi:hypothetical protein